MVVEQDLNYALRASRIDSDAFFFVS